MPRLRHPLIVVTLVACGVMLLVLALSPRWTAERLAADLREQIDAADEVQAASLVEPLAKLDMAALAHLVDLLDDERRPVRQAAREAISQRLEAWSSERTAASERSVERLAALLAAQEPPRDAHSRVFVKLTAIKLLRWPALSDEADRLEFLTDCTTILQRTLSAHVDEPEMTRQVGPVIEPAIEDVTELPLPPLDETRYEEPLQLPDEPAESESAPISLDSGEEASTPPARIELHRPQPIRASEINMPSDQVDDEALRSLSTRSLIRHLQGAPTTADSVEGELRRRGFDDQAMQLARALDDPDPLVRQQLAESLPGVSGIDPMPWLWELAEDQDESVRRTARGILATSSNPQTRARVGRLK